MIQAQRIYGHNTTHDTYRILVDRLWPRGISKAKAKLDLWMKDIAPSNELRQWYHHDPSQWNEFKRRYFAELKNHENLIQDLRKKAKNHTITLLYAAKDEQYNNAIALKEYLLK